MGGGDTFQSSSYHSFSLKPGRVKNTTPPLIKIQSLSLSLLLSYIALLNQDGARYAIAFSLPIQYIHVETRHSRLLQASEQCFHKTPNYSKNSLLQEEGMFGVLRKHRSEACERRLCLVSTCIY